MPRKEKDLHTRGSMGVLESSEEVAQAEGHTEEGSRGKQESPRALWGTEGHILNNSSHCYMRSLERSIRGHRKWNGSCQGLRGKENGD